MSSTSIRGSQRSSALRTSVSSRPTVAASIVSNTKSCTPQPNSGRMGRSPGAVLRMISIAWSTSSSPDASAMPPRAVDREGEGEARAEEFRHRFPNLSDVDHGAGDLSPCAEP